MTGIERVRVLTGHVNPDTAYLVDDYPYGRVLRCKMRYWVETAAKGSAKGQQRFVSQTTDPRREGTVWNKPHPGAYSQIVVLYLDEINHVHPFGIGFHLRPVDDARVRLMGIYDQLPERERARYDVLLRLSERYAPQWHEWEEKIHAIGQHITETGADPELTNGTWQQEPRGRLWYLGAEADIYCAIARQRLTKPSV